MRRPVIAGKKISPVSGISETGDIKDNLSREFYHPKLVVHLAENRWYIVAENRWYIVAENRWYIHARKLTVWLHSAQPKNFNIG
jgi:hypothetical protein